jgi:hypothetical protein
MVAHQVLQLCFLVEQLHSQLIPQVADRQAHP